MILTILLWWLVASVLLVMLPFWVMGWLFAAWRPFTMTLILWGLAVFAFHLWSFGWLYLPFQYFLALAGYLHGGSVRTGTKIEDLGEQTAAKGES